MTDNKIKMFLHCKKCLSEVKLAPSSGFGNERLAVGWTKEGFQVWCGGCNQNIIHIDFKEQKVTLI